VIFPFTKSVRGEEEGKIVHFVGSPKPWDVFGKMVHSNYSVFEKVMRKTEFKNFKPWKEMNFSIMYRTVRIARQYLRHGYKRFGNH
jgi:hypothetical protein